WNKVDDHYNLDFLSDDGQVAPIAELHRVERLIFHPNHLQPEVMVYLDGSAPRVQTPGGRGGGGADCAGDGLALDVDAGYDYTFAGDDDITVNGTDDGNVIVLGRGNTVVRAGAGADIIMAQDPETSGNMTISSGAGFDVIRVGAGDDVFVFGAGNK